MFVNTMSVAFLPMVPVFASIATFVGHVLAGNDLHPAQVIIAIHTFYMCMYS